MARSSPVDGRATRPTGATTRCNVGQSMPLPTGTRSGSVGHRRVDRGEGIPDEAHLRHAGCCACSDHRHGPARAGGRPFDSGTSDQRRGALQSMRLLLLAHRPLPDPQHGHGGLPGRVLVVEQQAELPRDESFGSDLRRLLYTEAKIRPSGFSWPSCPSSTGCDGGFYRYYAGPVYTPSGVDMTHRCIDVSGVVDWASRSLSRIHCG